MRNAYKFLVGKSEGKSPVRYLGVGERITLNRILNQRIGVDWIHVGGARGIVAGCYEHGNELLSNC